MDLAVKTYGADYPIHLAGLKRSAKWPAVRKAHLKKHPRCEFCGNTTNLNVHHLKPFHIHPELELDPGNLATVCEGPTVNCHYLFGHFMDWKNFNEDFWKDVERFKPLIKQKKRQA